MDWEFFGLKACHFSGLKSSPIARSLICAFVGFSLVSGCASVEDDLANDPFEEVNRTIFDFNNEIDNSVFEPVAQTYVDNVPNTLRLAVRNALKFLKTPMIFANNVLQGNLDGAGNTVSRFLVNGITGFGGTVDVAADSGVPYVKEDFGQTLAVWGVPDGPYLVLPGLGPSTMRDTLAMIPDAFLTPLWLIDHDRTSYSLTAIDLIDTRARYLGLESVVIGDEYLFYRDAYLQSRQFEIKDGEIEDDFDDFDDFN
mgnify:CR=1 FL=1